VYPGQDARRRTTLAYARWGDSVWERTVLGKGLRDMMKPPGLARQTTNGVKSMTTAGGANGRKRNRLAGQQASRK